MKTKEQEDKELLEKPRLSWDKFLWISWRVDDVGSFKVLDSYLVENANKLIAAAKREGMRMILEKIYNWNETEEPVVLLVDRLKKEFDL